MSGLPIVFRNVVRYVADVDASVPLYAALGFEPARRVGDMAVLQNKDGVKVVLHAWEGRERAPLLDTALGFTMAGNDAKAARAHVEAAGWKLLRAPDDSDEGFFFIYGDLDGNPINLVGAPR